MELDTAAVQASRRAIDAAEGWCATRKRVNAHAASIFHGFQKRKCLSLAKR